MPSTLATFRSRRVMRDRCCVMEAANKPTDSKYSAYRIVHYTAKQEQSEHLIVQQAISDSKTSRPAVAKNATVGKVKSSTVVVLPLDMGVRSLSKSIETETSDRNMYIAYLWRNCLVTKPYANESSLQLYQFPIDETLTRPWSIGGTHL
jgi:hypothetical protein